MDNYVEAPIYHDFNQPNYASIYRVKFESEFVFVYVEYNNKVPSFDEFVKAVRYKCAIEENVDVTVKDDKECAIPDSITFAYYMINVYNQESFFEVIINPRESNQSTVVVPPTKEPESHAQEEFTPIYENPDKFFVFYLSKDLINYFKHQTKIICSPTGAQLIQIYNLSAVPSLEASHKKSIIQISANHLMLVKHNEPSVQDRTIWAKVICEVFTQFRDSNTQEYYFAVYNPTKGDGFLGNRVKLLMKTAKKAKDNLAAIEKQSQPQTTEKEQTTDTSIPLDCDLQNLVNLMKVADVSTDVSLIVEYHKKTFSIRQHYRRSKDIDKLVSEFPRFFDVNSLIDYDFAQLYPLSGLVTFTQDVQATILKIAQESSNYNKFPLSHKNLAQPLNALLHLIILFPPTSLGRGQKNRVKIEQAFPRLVKIHEVNEPLIDVTKDNPENTPFIVVSGSSDNFNKNYYVVFQNNFIECQTAFNAIDIFFKVEQHDDTEWTNAKPYTSLPGPSKLAFLRSFMPGGKFHNLHFLEMYKAMYKEFGPIFKLPALFDKPEIVFTFDPKDMEKIFRNDGQWPIRRGMDTFEYYRKNIRPDIFKKCSGLVSDQGESWAKLRTAANPIMMKPKVVKAYIPDIDNVAKDFINKIRIFRDRDAKNEMPDDFHNELNKWSLESIALVALEHRLGLITSDDDPDNQKLINAVKDFFSLSYELDIQPSIWKYYKTPKFNRMMDALEVMTNLSKKHIDRAIERLENQTESNDDHEESVLQKILRVDKDYAVVMALDMLLAGIDTTASATACLLYNLANHQKVQDKLREELMTLLPNPDSPLTPESLNSLPYMRACVKESMRVTPIIPGHMRCTGRNIILQGYQIPKGIDCLMGTVTLLHDENFVELAKEFIPERFIREPQVGCPNAKDIHPFLMLPFGFGARTCIGRRFAEMEIEVLTIRLLREFKIEWNYGPLKFGNALIITPATNLRYKITNL